MYLEQFFVEGLGCASYIVGCEAHGVAAVVDPDRDVQKYLEAAAARSLRIAYIIETHLHADHVSGNTELASRTGASIYLHEASGAEFAHQSLRAGDHLMLGNSRLDVLHTPGHTPESITLLVSDTTRAEKPWLALTGDTLFVGDVGRPDLVGLEAARGLAGQMHTTLFDQLLSLDDGVLIYPGHGAGSLCGRSLGSMRSTTLGYERMANPSLTPRGKQEFVEYAISNLPEQPGNNKRIKAMNRQGPNLLGEVVPRPLTIQESIPYFQHGAAMLDLRSKAAFIRKHVPGAVHLEADDQLSNRIGFVLSPESPLVLVLKDVSDYQRVVHSLARVGFELVVGYLAETLDEWESLGLPTTSGDIENLKPAALYDLLVHGNGDKPQVIDVREAWEFKSGHVPEAKLIPLGDLMQRINEIDSSRPVAVICATGSRSQSAAALLAGKGFETVYNIVGGMYGWQSNRLPVER